jgi:hypothetical protein
MSVLSSVLRKQLELGVLAARRAAELGARSAIENLGVFSDRKPDHVTGDAAALRNGLRAKWRQLGLENELLVAECAFEQWHRLLFARFLAENGLLLHPDLNIPVTLDECDELAGELGEPDGWSVAARFASQILPGIFRLDDPCVRIRMAPEHRIALEEILTGLPAEVFTADDSLGWVYQYWQKDSKDEVNASERKVGGADLGPVTQLFTENYMVRFLLENSLGAWWAARHPQSPLLKSWEYLRFNDDGAPAAGTFDGWPARVAEVTVMDPCCGSGHFLVDAFGMLWRMRAEEEGIPPVEAQDAVLRDNLFGLELDPRCVQIAMFAVAFQAWKDGSGWRRLPTPNIACSGIPVKTPLAEWTALAKGDERLKGALTKLHALFRDADTLGSLIDPRRAVDGWSQRSTDDADWEDALPLLMQAVSSVALDPATAVLGADASSVVRAATFLSDRYVLVATNPPFLGAGNFDDRLSTFLQSTFTSGSADLSTAFLLRCAELNCVDGTNALVTPYAWLSLNRFEKLRRAFLLQERLELAAGLGSGAFGSISGEVVNVVLTIATPCDKPVAGSSYASLDVSNAKTPDDVRSQLRDREVSRLSQSAQLANPGSMILFESVDFSTTLGDRVDAVKGLSIGDRGRFVRCFWECDDLVSASWSRLRTTPSGSTDWSGQELAIRWTGEGGEFYEYVVERLGAMGTGAWIRGERAWGESGLIVGLVGSMQVSFYQGEFFDANVVALNCHESHIPAIRTFLESTSFGETLRKFNKKFAIERSYLQRVPFDLEHWQHAASDRFPDGLPEPWSDDPTQWLFEGRPEVSTSPLQVAVGRLLGFRWPEQPEHDDLDQFADVDGIVCLPSVAGEAPAAEQLADLLAAAYGAAWNAGTLSKLLAEAGSKKKTLADWLRDEFFKQHCSLFGNRPFVWHVWDGHPQGFSALVNYHRLDRKALEKLTYTYLGTDWIERQRAAVRDDEPGAEARLAAAESLKKRLELILKGDAPHDIYVRWKPLDEQPLGWEPDLDDGVRLNVRPFVEAGVLRSTFNIHWKKDRGTNPDGSERLNDIHVTLAEKQQARKKDR